MRDISCWAIFVFVAGLLALLFFLAAAGGFGPSIRHYPDGIVSSEPGHDHGFGYWQRRKEGKR